MMINQKFKERLLGTEGITPCEGITRQNGTKDDNLCNDDTVVQFFNVEGLDGKFKLYINKTSFYSNRLNADITNLFGYITDLVSECKCEVRVRDITKVSEESLLGLMSEKLKTLIKKTPTQRTKVTERKRKKETKINQKETFEAMAKALGLEHKITVSKTGKVVKVQVNSDIEKMKKIFAILADKTFEEVDNIFLLTSVN